MTGLEDSYPALLATLRRTEAAHASRWLAKNLERASSEQNGSRVEIDSLKNPVFRHGFLYRVTGHFEDVISQWDWLRAREPIQGMELRVYEHIPEEFRDLSQPSSWRVLKLSPESWFTANSVGDALCWGFVEPLRARYGEALYVKTR